LSFGADDVVRSPTQLLYNTCSTTIITNPHIHPHCRALPFSPVFLATVVESTGVGAASVAPGKIEPPLPVFVAVDVAVEYVSVILNSFAYELMSDDAELMNENNDARLSAERVDGELGEKRFSGTHIGEGTGAGGKK
jgi:hypothetical protein